MRKGFALVIMIALSLASHNVKAQDTLTIDLWPKGTPKNAESVDNEKATMYVYLPSAEKSSGAAIVCLPGGGYSHLAIGHEGNDWRGFFNDRGIAFIVLKYRMPHGNRAIPFADANEAIKLVRDKAAGWNIDPTKVGIMGSSAGGHLASTVATHNDSLTVPDFQVLFYPVITMDKQYTHQGSCDNLLGKEAPESLINEYSNEKQVSAITPPAIILLSDDDKAVPPYNGVSYYMALKSFGIPASLHVYPSGGHGWGYRDKFRYHTEMLADLDCWLTSMKLTNDKQQK